ncbi:MAG: ABC transporter ATP-binding protein [Ruminococcaceae bacterium]|nr:ABC transporter ATP-binding protein [Oscillospiraceae bacterium]
MKFMLRTLKSYRLLAVLSLLLLLVQAGCDLLLPAYTSELIDTGIQNNGIGYATPLRMTEEDAAGVSLFMSDTEAEMLAQHYQVQDGVLVLLNTAEENLQQLENIFVAPLFAKQTAVSQNLLTLPTGEELLSMPSAQRDDLHTQAQAVREQIEAGSAVLGETLKKNTAVSVVVSMFNAAGGDANGLRTQYLWQTGISMLGITLAMVAIAILLNYVTAIIGSSVARDLRNRVFNKVLSFSGNEMNNFSTSSLITRTTNDIQHVQMVIMIALRMVLYAPLMSIGGIVMVMRSTPGLTWIVALAVGIILAALGLLSVFIFPKFKIMQKLVDGLNRISRELLSGVQVIRAFGREEEGERRFEKANTDLTKTMLFTSRAMSVLEPLLNLMMYGFSALIIYVAAPRIDAGTMEVGDMTAFTTYAIMIAGGFLMVAMVFVYAPRALVAASRLQQVLDTEPMVSQSEDAVDLCDAKGIVEFKNVSFRYPGTQTDTLHNISFTARPGETFAIVGGTGCGKSTVLSLLERFYDATDGSITIDSIDITKASLASLRRILGYVPQKGVLFSGTIASNIGFGVDTLSEEDMHTAAAVAQAKDFINEKTDGYESAIAQGGSNVSGGQKQRLSIARAIAKDPKIYLFDDSFSALDYKTDAILRAALKKQVKDATVIIVAQRLSTVMHAEQILVLDEGRAVGLGTHEELLRNCSVYRNIAESQLNASELGLEEVTDGE